MIPLGAETVTRERRAAGAYVAGTWVPGATSNATIQASVQPLNGQELAMLPEGERTKDQRKVYTTSELRTPDQETQTPGDVVVVGSVRYKVVQVEHQRAVLPHYKARVVREREAG